MARKRTATERLEAKIDKRKRASNGKQSPHSGKAWIPKMGTNTNWRDPKEICEETGQHKEFILATGPTKKIVMCTRGCGYYKVYTKAAA